MTRVFSWLIGERKDVSDPDSTLRHSISFSLLSWDSLWSLWFFLPDWNLVCRLLNRLVVTLERFFSCPPIHSACAHSLPRPFAFELRFCYALTAKRCSPSTLWRDKHPPANSIKHVDLFHAIILRSIVYLLSHDSATPAFFDCVQLSVGAVRKTAHPLSCYEI